MVKNCHRITCIVLLGLLLIFSGAGRMTLADTQTKPSSKADINNLSDDIKITKVSHFL